MAVVPSSVLTLDEELQVPGLYRKILNYLWWLEFISLSLDCDLFSSFCDQNIPEHAVIFLLPPQQLMPGSGRRLCLAGFTP